MQASNSIVSLIQPLIEKIFGKDTFDLSFAVRKAGHFLEFSLLGAFTFALALKLGNRWYGYAFFYVLSVGTADEFIQNFTGRTSMVSDVLIDFAGAVAGFCIALIFKRYIVKNKAITLT